MSKFIDLTGQKFGKWTVIKLVQKNPTNWLCRCDCGTIKNIRGGGLRYGSTTQCRSCGNIGNNKKHGQIGTKIYKIWANMIQRVQNPNQKDYKHYGGRGIDIEDKQWMKFENFYKDMGNCPPGMTLDRIDNNKGYYKDNCRWTTREKQNKNRRSWKKSLDLSLTL